MKITNGSFVPFISIIIIKCFSLAEFSNVSSNSKLVSFTNDQITPYRTSSGYILPTIKYPQYRLVSKNYEDDTGETDDLSSEYFKTFHNSKSINDNYSFKSYEISESNNFDENKNESNIMFHSNDFEDSSNLKNYLSASIVTSTGEVIKPKSKAQIQIKETLSEPKECLKTQCRNSQGNCINLDKNNFISANQSCVSQCPTDFCKDANTFICKLIQDKSILHYDLDDFCVESCKKNFCLDESNRCVQTEPQKLKSTNGMCINQCGKSECLASPTSENPFSCDICNKPLIKQSPKHIGKGVKFSKKSRHIVLDIEISPFSSAENYTLWLDNTTTSAQIDIENANFTSIIVSDFAEPKAIPQEHKSTVSKLVKVEVKKDQKPFQTVNEALLSKENKIKQEILSQYALQSQIKPSSNVEIITNLQKGTPIINLINKKLDNISSVADDDELISKLEKDMKDNAKELEELDKLQDIKAKTTQQKISKTDPQNLLTDTAHDAPKNHNSTMTTKFMTTEAKINSLSKLSSQSTEKIDQVNQIKNVNSTTIQHNIVLQLDKMKQSLTNLNQTSGLNLTSISKILDPINLNSVKSVVNSNLFIHDYETSHYQKQNITTSNLNLLPPSHSDEKTALALEEVKPTSNESQISLKKKSGLKKANKEVDKNSLISLLLNSI